MNRGRAPSLMRPESARLVGMTKTSPDYPASAREPVDPDALVEPAAARLENVSKRATVAVMASMRCTR
jgi:hypothetical protein